MLLKLMKEKTMDFSFSVDGWCRHWVVLSTMNIPISVCGIDSQSTHYFVKSQGLVRAEIFIDK